MSAAKWRRSMNAGARAVAGAAPALVSASASGYAPTSLPPGAGLDPDGSAPDWLQYLWRTVKPRHFFTMALVLLFPFVASPFFTFQVATQSLILGLIALSLSFLAGFGGMVSLAQMTVAGIAGYGIAVLGTSSSAEISLGWPWWASIPVAVVIAVLCATAIGWLSVRTEGIYTIMITLAIGVAFYYLVLQNYSVFNGFQGLRELKPPTVFGIGWREPVPFYFLSLVCAMVGYFLISYIVRAPFGIALQGIRDNPRRMAALGYDVVAHRVAAYALAGLLAAVGGVLLAWYNALMSPGSVGTGWLINLLVIAVLGGMKHPIGAFLGAIIFVLLQTFAVDFFDRERFNLVIGGIFLAIVLFSPDGLLGLWAKLRSRFGPNQALTSTL
jgi:branched-chain amino acid transport system permease protein